MSEPTVAPALAPPGSLLRLLLGIGIFAALSLWAAIASPGFLEADSCTHYMYARHAIDEPKYLLDVWGRPLCTGAYTLPAAIGGVLGVRVMSLLLAIGCGLVTYRIAIGLKFRLPALAPILLFAQPVFFLHSFSELTEIPFAFVAVLAFWAYQSRQYLAMTLLVAITPSGRPEGFLLIALAGVALLAHRRWYYLFLLPLPLLLWSYLGYVSWGSQPGHKWYLWLKVNWPYATQSAYGSGPWYWFIIQLPVLVSPLVFPALLLGVWRCLKLCGSKESPELDAHRRRCMFLVVAIPLFILFVHSVLWTRGLMASNGSLRYLLCVAPLWALLCAKGWEWAWANWRLPAPFSWVAFAASIPIFANGYYKFVPLKIYNEDYLGRAAAKWYRQTPGLAKDYPRVMASLSAVFFALDVSPSNSKTGVQWGQYNLKNHPDGSVLFWDINGLSNSSRDAIITRQEVEAAGWLYVGRIAYGDKECFAYLSPRDDRGAASDPGRFTTPNGR